MIQPCPLCGNKKIDINKAVDNHYRSGFSNIACNCGCELTMWAEIKEDKRKSWENRRKDMEKQQKALDRRTMYRWNRKRRR